MNNSSFSIAPHRWITTSPRAHAAILERAKRDTAFMKLRLEHADHFLQLVDRQGLPQALENMLDSRCDEIHIVVDGDKDALAIHLGSCLRAGAFRRLVWHDFARGPAGAVASFGVPETEVLQWYLNESRNPHLPLDPEAIDEGWRARYLDALQTYVQAVEEVEGEDAFDYLMYEPDDGEELSDEPDGVELDDQPAPGSAKPITPSSATTKWDARWTVRLPAAVANEPRLRIQAKAHALSAAASELSPRIPFGPIHVWGQQLDLVLIVQRSRRGLDIEVRISGPLAAASVPLCGLRLVDAQGQVIAAMAQGFDWTVDDDAKTPAASIWLTLPNPNGQVEDQLAVPGVSVELQLGLALRPEARTANSVSGVPLLAASSGAEERGWRAQSGPVVAEVMVSLADAGSQGEAVELMVQVAGLGTTPTESLIQFEASGATAPVLTLPLCLEPDGEGGLLASRPLADDDGSLAAALRTVTGFKLLLPSSHATD